MVAPSYRTPPVLPQMPGGTDASADSDMTPPAPHKPTPAHMSPATYTKKQEVEIVTIFAPHSPQDSGMH